jgi:hypothetical protein
MGVLIATSLAACGHASPRVVPRPEGDQLGCFRLRLSAYAPEMNLGGDEVFISPPELIELLDRPSQETFGIRCTSHTWNPGRPDRRLAA